MAVTRINNNQITDATAGNAYVGVNAASKVQNYTITSQKIANNLTYGSDLTVTGNFTVQGTTTTVDTVNTLIQDPLITLADGQTTGTPTVDIGTIGLRGSENSAVMAWKESAKEFVTALSNTTVSNTTFTISSYANLHTGNFIAQGTTSLVGNVIGTNTNFTSNITGGNLLTPGLISATSTIDSGANITGANLVTGGVVTATGNVRGANLNTAGVVSATGNIKTDANSIVSGYSTVTGNITGGNLVTGGNVDGTTGYFTGNLTVLGNLNATVGVVYANSGIFYGNSVTGNNAAFAGVPGFTQLGSNVVMQFAGNVNSYSQLNFENINNGTQASTDLVLTADNGNDGSNFINMGITGSNWDGTQTNSLGNALRPNDGYLYTDSGNLIIGTTVPLDHLRIIVGGDNNNYISAEFHDPGTESSNTTSGTLTVTGGIGATKNINGANIFTPGVMSSTGNVTGGNILTGGLITATGAITGANITGANLITAGLITATGNITGGNVNTSQVYGASGLTLVTGSGTITLNPAGNVSMSSKNINNLANPVSDQDAATKYYVDTVAQGLDPKASVVYATAAALAAYTYNNGTSGVGATITANANGALSIDGFTPTVGERVLIKNETSTNQPYNGIYTVTAVGSAGAPFVLTRAADFDQPAEIPSSFVFVEHGSTNADTGWVCTTNVPITIGTTNIVFTQFSGAGTYTANTSAGLSLIGTVFNAKVDNITTAFDGGGNISVKVSANLTTPNIGAATGTSLSVTGNVTAQTFIGNISGNVDAGGANTNIQFNDGDILAGSAAFTFDKTSNAVVATGNITAANAILSATTASTSKTTGALKVAGGVGVAGDLYAGNSVVVDGGSYGNVTTTAFASVFATGAGPNPYSIMQVRASDNVSGIGMQAYTGSGILYGNTAITFALGTIRDKDVPSSLTTKATLDSTGLTVTGIVSASGNITGGNLITAGLATVTGNVNTSAGVLATGNVTGGNLVTGGLATVTGNISTGANLNVAGLATVTGNISGGANLIISGYQTITGNITSSANIQGANVIGGNIVLTGNSINELAPGGTIAVNGAGANTNFSVSGLTPNVFFVNASTNTASFGNATQTVNALVAFNASTSLLMPVGNTGQRPGTGVTGMLRFNTTVNNLEIFDNSAWATVGTPSFTVVADEQFTGNGVQTQFTLGSTHTTNSCIVSINGIVQIPNTAYSVNGTDPTCILTFTEAPAAGDLIDVREITTTSEVSSISNSSGNAVIYANAVSANIDITGNVVASQGLYAAHEIVAGLEGYTNLNTYSANITYPTGTNRMLVGPMTVESGVVVTLAGSAIVVIL